MSPITPKQIDLFKHALGYPKCYRNHFVVTAGSEDHREWKTLCTLGLAELNPYKGPLIGGDDSRSYHVTPAGRMAIEVEEGHAFVCSNCELRRRLTAKIAKALGWTVRLGWATCPMCHPPTEPER